MRVLLLRHAESRSNAARDVVALPEAEGDRLSALGEEQARAAARALRGQGISGLLTSPMRRAIETARILAEELDLEPAVDPDLHELRESEGYGDLEVAEQVAQRWSVWMPEHSDDPGYSWRGAESFADVTERVRRVKERLAASAEDPVLAVTHGIFMRFFLADCLLGERFGPDLVERLWQLRTVNCGLSVFEHGARDPVRNPAPRPWRCLTWMCSPEAMP